MNTQRVISIAVLAALGVAINSALSEVNNWFTVAMYAVEWSEQLKTATSTGNASAADIIPITVINLSLSKS
ncbi:MAG: hypothetical protein HAW66_09930 [Shewanella sp.]|nr:hypothetical protein [Shewanella sp.]